MGEKGKRRERIGERDTPDTKELKRIEIEISGLSTRNTAS
jgi:hypothetical protein